MTTRVSIETPAGTFVASFTDHGLAALDFPSARERNISPANRAVPAEWIRLTRDAVNAVLNGRIPDALPPLDLSGATEFQRAVWSAMRQIPCGATRSYADIARMLGKPNAARAVGNACGANPIPLLIPCHRVLASGQRIGGFSGGLPWKRRLLKAEGITFEDPA